MAQDIVGILKSIRAHIDAKPREFEAYQDYFDTLRLLGKEDKQKSYQHNLWLRGERPSIARSRKHIQKYYNTSDIGNFPERLKPISKRPHLISLSRGVCACKLVYSVFMVQCEGAVRGKCPPLIAAKTGFLHPVF